MILKTAAWIAFLALAGRLAMAEEPAQSVPPSSAREHWAYQPPKKTAIPPEFSGSAALQQPLDAFILQRLRAEGLQFSSLAPRQAILRRVTLDLTGFPPDPAEIAAFTSDHRPDAFERVVDRLLASPRYGERMATPWLDLARYADTHGYHSDSERQMWPWRDWVIAAFNRGLPYDQFTQWQIAGDLLAERNSDQGEALEQRLASGFLRNTMLNDENGAVPEEFLAEYVADRVHTVGAVWLSQTFACARCHDHKYDPISQREYYQLFAFFNQVPENGLGGRRGNSPPTLIIPTPAQQRELTSLQARIERSEQSLADIRLRAVAAAAKWANSSAARGNAVLPENPLLYLPFEALPSVQTGNDKTSISLLFKGEPAFLEGRVGAALLCDGQTYAELPPQAPLAPQQSGTVSLWVFPTTADPMVLLCQLDETQYRRGLELSLADGRIEFRQTHQSDKDELAIRSRASLPLRRWTHVALRYDGSRRAAGVTLFLAGRSAELETLRDRLVGHIQVDQPLRVGSDGERGFRGLLDEFRLYGRALSDEEIQALAGDDPLAGVLALPEAKRSLAQQQLVVERYLTGVDPAFVRLKQDLFGAERQKEQLLAAAPSVMVMQEAPQPRPTSVLAGGRYDQPREQVLPELPAALGSLYAELPRNRLGLARWLTDDRNPLTARVGVNHAWRLFFGSGLVPTSDDFGLRGDKPTHPELLDWLAREWSDHGWDGKRLHRMIVTSAVYRQSSVADETLFASDPHNRLLARGPRLRLDAEQIRDAALSAAGVITPIIGGPGARGYEPGDLWRDLAYDIGEYSAQSYRPSRGQELFRRSVYLFWKRSSPPLTLTLFDAPSRETCIVTRGESATPLQSLALRNDPTFVEAARLIAARVLRENPAGLLSSGELEMRRVEQLSLLLLSRSAEPSEQKLLGEFLTRRLAEPTLNLSTSRQLLAVGQTPLDPQLDPREWAAWTLVARLLMARESFILN